MADMPTTRFSPSLCPLCGYRVDAASAMEGYEAPTPGDWSLCLRCGGVLVFDMLLRPAVPAAGAYAALRLTHPIEHAKLEMGRAVIRRLASTGDWIPDRGGRT